MPVQKPNAFTPMNPLSAAILTQAPQHLQNQARFAKIVEAAHQRPLNATDVMLLLWYRKDDSEKALRAFVMGLFPRVKPSTANGLLRRLLKAPHIGEEILQAGEDVTVFENILASLGDRGYFGIADYHGEIWPIALSFESDSDYQWAINNESMVRVECARSLMLQCGLQEIKCRILLFGTKGFSASYEAVHLVPANSPRAGQLVKNGRIVTR